MRLRGQEELRCTYRLTGQTRCLPARELCNMVPSQTFRRMPDCRGWVDTTKASQCRCGVVPCKNCQMVFAWKVTEIWAPTTELLRRSTSGGAVRYGLHTWDCYSDTQATIALSSAESEFYATGSATARGLQCKVYLSETERLCELDVYSDSTAARGMCQRTGVGKVRHLELRFLWIQERLRLKAFRLNKETTEEMTVDILTKYCQWPQIEQHCATLNLRFPVKGLSSLMVAGLHVHCANADVEAVSGEASLDTVTLLQTARCGKVSSLYGWCCCLRC